MNICLYGSGSKCIDDKYIDTGYSLGVEIAKHGHTLVFGGGCDGLMGAVARGVYDNGGEIISVYPEWMNKFCGLFTDSEKLVITETMDERKNNFVEYADCILVTPGGIGTLDEFFEIVTLKKLKMHDMQIIVFNMFHFFDKMLDMLDEMIDGGFVNPDNKDLFIVTSSLEETVDYF